MTEEALEIGKELLSNIPELKTKDKIQWSDKGAEKKLRLLSKLLKVNAIPTKSLSFHGKKQFKREL